MSVTRPVCSRKPSIGIIDRVGGRESASSMLSGPLDRTGPVDTPETSPVVTHGPRCTCTPTVESEPPASVVKSGVAPAVTLTDRVGSRNRPWLWCVK